MIELTREVRFELDHDRAENPPVLNSWSGSRGVPNLAAFVRLRCTVAGAVDSRSSYVCNIKLIDNLIRNEVVPSIGESSDIHAWDDLLFVAVKVIEEKLPASLRLVRLACLSSPFVSYSWWERMPDMVLYTEQFEFSASHRLNNPDLSADENRDLFGKCNHPNGHGHNYVVEVTIQRPHQDSGAIRDLQRTVKECVIDKLDHKHLNLDVSEFKALNPTVENIALVVFEWLKNAIAPNALQSVRVYETPKTWAEVNAQTIEAT